MLELHLESQATSITPLSVRELNTLAVRGLVPMFDAKSGMFCMRLRRKGQSLEREGISPRYTIMALLGLHKAEAAGFRSPLDIRSILSGLIKNTAWLDNIGDLGLLLWLCALVAPVDLEQTCATLRLSSALSRYRGVREGRTMEMAWFLSGLAHAGLTGKGDVHLLKNLAFETLKVLTKNQGKNGVFGHVAAGGRFSARLRARLGSFADQVYPIYALSVFSQAYVAPEALKMAEACGETICQVQGPLGQWWWHYDSQTGRVVGRYPVYAVHQHGMAPLALFALSESSGRDFSLWIQKGLQWVFGRNELNRDFRETPVNIIWRSIHQTKLSTYLREAKSLLGSNQDSNPPQGLRIKFECRPYELGWLLYAFANQGFA